MKKLLLLLLIVPVLGFGQEPEFKFENNLMVGSNAIKNVVLSWQKVFLVLHL